MQEDILNISHEEVVKRSVKNLKNFAEEHLNWRRISDWTNKRLDEASIRDFKQAVDILFSSIDSSKQVWTVLNYLEIIAPNILFEGENFVLGQYVLDIFAEHIDELNSHIPLDFQNFQFGKTYHISFFKWLEYLGELGGPENKSIIVRIVRQHKKNIISLIRDTSLFSNIRRDWLFIMGILYDYGGVEEQKEVLQLYREFVDEGDNIEELLDYLVGVNYVRVFPKVVTFILQDYGKRYYGVDFFDLAQAWQRGTKTSEFSRNIKDQLRKMKLLEQKVKGAVAVLVHEFGIKNFVRYPLEALVEQVKEKDNLQHRYGVVMTAVQDDAGENTGVFLNDVEMFAELHTQLREWGIFLRFVEVDGKLDVVKRLLRLDKRYGKEQKIAFLIGGGHGNKEVIQIGPSGTIGEFLTINDLTTGLVPQKLISLFEKGATIILNSCSTGAEKGIAQKLSLFGITVSAPKDPSNTQRITVQKTRQGKLYFTVERDGSEDITYYKGKKRRNTLNLFLKFLNIDIGFLRRTLSGVQA